MYELREHDTLLIITMNNRRNKMRLLYYNYKLDTKYMTPSYYNNEIQ